MEGVRKRTEDYSSQNDFIKKQNKTSDKNTGVCNKPLYISNDPEGKVIRALSEKLFSQVLQLWSHKILLNKSFVIDFGWTQHLDSNHKYLFQLAIL